MLDPESSILGRDDPTHLRKGRDMAKKGRTPAEFIQVASSSQVECRLMRHAWDVNKGTVERDLGDLIWRMPCMRDCGTRKSIRIRRDGTIANAWYKWDKDYHVQGGLDKEHLAELRSTYIKEMMRS